MAGAVLLKVVRGQVGSFALEPDICPGAPLQWPKPRCLRRDHNHQMMQCPFAYGFEGRGGSGWQRMPNNACIELDVNLGEIKDFDARCLCLREGSRNTEVGAP